MSSVNMALKRAIQVFDVLKKSQFDAIFSTVKIIDAAPNMVKAEYTVLDDHLNKGGTLHGGFTAAAIDSLTTLALINSEEDPRPGVSLNLNINYLKGLKIGEKVTFEGSVERRGRSIAYTTGSVFNEKGELAAHGTHIKHLGN